MRQQEVFNKIGAIITELNEQYDYLKTLPAPIDDLELELFAANANFLSDHLEILRKLNASANKNLPAEQAGSEPYVSKSFEDKADQDLEEPETFTPTIPATLAGTMPGAGHFHVEQPDNAHDTNPGFEFDLTPAVVPYPEEQKEQDIIEDDDIAYVDDPEDLRNDELPETTVENTPVADIDLKPDTEGGHFSFVRSTEPETIRHNLELNEADTFEEDEPHEETVAEALAQSEVIEEHPSDLTDINTQTKEPEDKPLTLNERIAAQTGHAQPEAQLQPITDLRSAITMNDKMLFVRDLFNGYSLAYSEAIEILNRFGKLEDAQRFLAVNYETKNNWADKPATREKFHDLLKRRFA